MVPGGMDDRLTFGGGADLRGGRGRGMCMWIVLRGGDDGLTFGGGADLRGSSSSSSNAGWKQAAAHGIRIYGRYDLLLQEM